MADTPAWTLYAQWQVAAWTLYAQWRKINATILLNPNGGTFAAGVMPIIFAPAGQPYPTLPTPTRAGMTFVGWYLPGPEYITPSSVVPTEDIVLTAAWQYDSSTVVITYETNASDVVAPAAATVTVGGPYGSSKLPTLTRPQCRFDGWYTASYGGTPLRGPYIVIDPNNHTLYAQWTYIGPDGGSSDPSVEPWFVGGFVPQISPAPPVPGVGSLIYDPTTGQLVADI